MDFRIKQLQSFLALAETLHYGTTARALYMSQPTMTAQIKSLEETFGTRLFERDKRHVRLTESGQAFRVYAYRIMQTVDSARVRFTEMDKRQHLRISCGPWGQATLLPKILLELSRSHPAFELEVHELTTEQKMVQLRNGEVDALLMVRCLPIEGMEFEKIITRPMMAMVSRQTPWARKRSISIQDLRRVPIIAPHERDCSLRQRFLHSLFETYGIQPEIVAIPQSCQVQLAYVAAGKGVVVGAKCETLGGRRDVVAIPFKESLPAVELGLATLQSCDSIALTVFRKVLRSCTADLYPKGDLRS